MSSGTSCQSLKNVQLSCLALKDIFAKTLNLRSLRKLDLCEIVMDLSLQICIMILFYPACTRFMLCDEMYYSLITGRSTLRQYSGRRYLSLRNNFRILYFKGKLTIVTL